MKIPIIYEDEHLVVVNKPTGVVVTPGPGHPFEETIAGWLMEYVGEDLYSVGNEDRWGIVHRLDKQTSGILLTVKTPEMYEHLVGQFRSREVHKEYITLVWGDVLHTLAQKSHNKIGIQSEPREVEKMFVVNAPIARHPKGISSFIIDKEGKSSQTIFNVEEVSAFEQKKEAHDITLLKAYPKTGRTHQIRVHIKAFGHPVIGDGTYQTKYQKERSRYLINRQFLHARKIEFSDLAGKSISFEAELPKDLKVCLEKCGLNS